MYLVGFGKEVESVHSNQMHAVPHFREVLVEQVRNHIVGGDPCGSKNNLQEVA